MGQPSSLREVFRIHDPLYRLQRAAGNVLLLLGLGAAVDGVAVTIADDTAIERYEAPCSQSYNDAYGFPQTYVSPACKARVPFTVWEDKAEARTLLLQAGRLAGIGTVLTAAAYMQDRRQQRLDSREQVIATQVSAIDTITFEKGELRSSGHELPPPPPDPSIG